ncbi:MAG: hypothetical protein HKN43_00545 [Rhodothermales bacterium]|nr:hypothetical protein [Rhodothermales bacterium]
MMHEADKLKSTAEPDSKVRRISTQTKGLVEDMRTWVDLKMQYTQLDLEDRVDTKVNEAAKGAIVAAVGLITLVFVLLTIGLGLGVLFDSVFLGFLGVTGVLVVALIVAAIVNPKLVNIKFTDQKSGRKKSLKS